MTHRERLVNPRVGFDTLLTLALVVPAWQPTCHALTPWLKPDTHRVAPRVLDARSRGENNTARDTSIGKSCTEQDAGNTRRTPSRTRSAARMHRAKCVSVAGSVADDGRSRGVR